MRSFDVYINNIYVVGDIHGEFKKLNSFINKKNPSLILQCGDFGFWPKFHKTSFVDSITGKICHYDQYSTKNGDTNILWCDGNHEDFFSLNILEDDEIQTGIFYMRRGSVFTLPDGRNVLFMGGAQSIDKNQRKIGINWFPEETINQKDIYDLPDIKIDIVISHTCPHEFNVLKKRDIIFLDIGDKNKDPSKYALSCVLEKYHPSLWYFGHYHMFVTGYDCGCRWMCLNKISDTGWWTKLLD